MKNLDELIPRTSCADCSLKMAGSFCDLPAEARSTFQKMKVKNTYSKGARLFTEGQPVAGVFILCRGRVKLSTNSRTGRSLILRVAGEGEVLGLSETISDQPSESTAEVIEPSQVNFVLKSDFLRFIEQNRDASMAALRHLNRQYQEACVQIQSFALSTRVSDKLAALLLDWSKSHPTDNGSVLIRNRFSHEEIAEMIGTSRETVTRILKDFRTRDLISIKGSELYIPNTRRLEAAIGNGR